ncbi:MAG TPA: DUF3299 domain-containing protein [Rhizobacter sp.]|nr:DUF3299 domain-containing protein [Rhizobacter sp.]
MKHRHLLISLLSLAVATGLPGVVLAQAAGSTPALSRPSASAPKAQADTKPAATQGGFRTTTWEELVPKDWDPLKQFQNMNLSFMSDADPRANELLKRMRETWDNAPTNNAMDGVAVRIPGYVVPLEESKSGLKEFLLVPYFGACIHTPPPPSNQIIDVKTARLQKGLQSMDTVWISGTLKTLRSDTFMGASSYRIEGALVEPYKDPVTK